MFFVYGWGENSKRYKRYKNISCYGCGRGSVPAQAAMQYSYVSLFFIPLIKWNRRYFLQCPYCGSVRAIGKNEFLALKKGPQEPMALPEKKEDPFGGEFDADAVAANAGESAE